MKIIKILSVVAMVILCSTTSFAKNKNDKGMYLFGVATSLTDSVVYVTEIQHFDNVGMSAVDFSKTISRYSIQLQNFVSVIMDTKFQTGVTFFSAKKKTVEKDKKKVLNRFVKKNKMLMVNIPDEDFKFEFVPLVEEE